MKKSYLGILFLLFTFLLVACSNETEKEPNVSEVEDVKNSDDEKVKKAIPLSDEQIKDIIINNLDQMESSIQKDFDESLMPIDENTFSEGESNTETESIVDKTKKDFENLVATDILDEWVRHYLYSAYISYHKEYLNTDDIQTRFEVLNQSDDNFEISFINLESNGGLSYIAGTQHLFYIKENGHWLLHDMEFFNPDVKPLDLTFKDLKEYYSQFNEDNIKFEAIEETNVNGEKYLIYKLGDEYYARNATDSTYNYEIIELYN